MTFVPMGWNAVLCGVKTRLELGQGIVEDGEAEQVSEPNAGQASQNAKATTEKPEPDGSSQGGAVEK
jgi:hypothetical protein